jgi:lipopolysaccharide export system protein LptA
MPAHHGPSSRTAALLLAAALGAGMLPAALRAERADRFKPTQVEADRMHYDDLKQVNVFTGSVHLTKGTISLRGDRLVLTQDPEGFQYGTATGGVASFRQKRDGVEEWVEGYGEEIHYDGKTETVRMTGRAKVRRLEGTRVVDEIDGAVIVYDSRTEQFEVDGGGRSQAAAASAAGSGRIRVVIQPRLGAAGAAPAAAPAAAAPLKPASSLSTPRAPDGR